jgi:uncharacterized protein YktA (UPF0223 family)
MARINSVKQSITWGEFRDKYSKFFPISDAKRREEKLKEEFERLTGRKPSGKVKRYKQEASAPDTWHDAGGDAERLHEE